MEHELPQAAAAALPSYVSTSTGPLRVYRAGRGPSLVVLPGLIMSAAVTARALTQAHPGFSLTVIELPGIGSSAKVAARDVGQIAAVIEEALGLLGIHDAVLMAYDLCAPIAIALASLRSGSARLLLLDSVKAQHWITRQVAPAAMAPREDGTHLPALWAHFRDLSMLDAANPSRVAHQGNVLPNDYELDAAVVAAAVQPESYAALWNCCAEAFQTGQAESGQDMDISAQLSQLAAGLAPQVQLLQPTPADGALHYSYLQLPSGLVHLRRAGKGGHPLLMFHSAPGSAEPLETLMLRLATHREVIVCDYLGNGDSDKATGDVDIATLAKHGLEIIDALELKQVDLFGTHTGAMIAMELSIQWPKRVRRMVLEAPVLIDPGFAADILVHYLPTLQPDRWGLHLLRAWNMRRDMFLFWPWYRQTREAARALGLPPLQTLHDWTIGLLKSGTTYHLSYRAAFVYDTRARLPLLTRPALICAGPADMLVEGLELARQLAPAGTVVAVTSATVWYPGQSNEAVAATIAMYDEFLRQ